MPRRDRRKPQAPKGLATAETVREGLAAHLPQAEIARRLGCTTRTIQAVMQRARAIHGKGWPFLDLVPPRPKPEVQPLAIERKLAREPMTRTERRAAMLRVLVEIADDDTARAADRVAAATAVLRIEPELPDATSSAMDDVDLLQEITRATDDLDGGDPAARRG